MKDYISTIDNNAIAMTIITQNIACFYPNEKDESICVISLVNGVKIQSIDSYDEIFDKIFGDTTE